MRVKTGKSEKGKATAQMAERNKNHNQMKTEKLTDAATIKVNNIVQQI